MYFSFMKTCISIIRLPVKRINACSFSKFSIHQYYSVNSSKNVVCFTMKTVKLALTSSQQRQFGKAYFTFVIIKNPSF